GGAERRGDGLRGLGGGPRRRARAATEQVRELEVSTAACRSELDGVRQTLWASGGDAIQQAGRELHLAEAALAGVTAARARVDAALGLLGVEVKTEKDYDRCASAAAARLADAGAKAAVTDAYFVAKNAAKDAERDLVRLTAERDSLSRRRGNMPEAWHRARLALAQAAGLREDELPFVAELVEVSTAHEQWREAFNLALGGFARTLLVDAAHLARFRSAIDGVSSEVRLNFEGVPTGLPLGGALDPGTLPGRLDFAGGPFEGWLRERLAERFAYVCVETPGQLGQHHKALTRGGQSSDGARGAHGGHGRANLLGFTNTRRLADLDLQMVALQEAAAVAAAEARGAGLRLDALDEQRAASQVLLDTTWQAIDVAHAQDQVERWRRAREAAKAQNPQLDDLATRAAELDAALADLQERLGRAKVAAETADAAWQQASEQVDATQAGLDAAEAAGTEVSATQGEYLTELLGTTADGGEPATPTVALAAFDTAVARAAERLRFEQEAATTALTHGADSLHATFEQFIARWPDPNLGTDPEASYADFERILATLETQRLHELEAEWRRALLRPSGADPTHLGHTPARGPPRGAEPRPGAQPPPPSQPGSGAGGVPSSGAQGPAPADSSVTQTAPPSSGGTQTVTPPPSSGTQPQTTQVQPPSGGTGTSTGTSAGTSPGGSAFSGGIPLWLIIALIILALLILGLIIFFATRNLHNGPNRVMAQAAAPMDARDTLESQRQERLRGAEMMDDYAKSRAAQRRPMPKDREEEEPLRESGDGPAMLNLFVEDQNTAIGRRNIHVVKPGYTFSVGGGKSDFLIFLVPIPPHIADVQISGNNCTFYPRMPEFFPDIGSQAVPNCIGKTIRVISKKNYELHIRMERYEDPLKALNKMLHSIQVPGEVK
ncbi:MAG: hypothetical protein FWG11_08865, partial [Promicromonosporaceae bacterium]|nr:hypothetical protein [Promicromonosporaceae bacterium]